MLRNLKVLLGQTVSAACVYVYYTASQGAFADSFHDESAGNVMALCNHARDDVVLTP